MANANGIMELQNQLNVDDVRITEMHRLLVEVKVGDDEAAHN